MTKRTCAVLLVGIFFLALFLVDGRADADVLNGTVELDYSRFISSSKDLDGTAMQTKSTDFNQRYNLYMNLEPLPTLKVSAGAVLDKDASDTSSESGGLRTAETTFSPTITLRFEDPFRMYSAETGYSRLEQTSWTDNSPASTTVNETYHATFGWRPIEFPTFGIQLTRMNTYDRYRTYQDTTADTAQLVSRYSPTRGVDSGYTVAYTDMRNHLSGLDIQSLFQNGRVGYTHDYWDKRGSFSSGYSIGATHTETSRQGSGEVGYQLYPLAALSSVSDALVTDTLSQNAALIDGNLTASANINLGSSLTLSGDIRAREMALDFYAMTEVNNVLIWVDRQLTPEIASSFSWDIYTSTDNLNWTFLQTVFPAAFGPYLNRFTMDFQNVKTRYLKVVTHPLAAAVQGALGQAYQNIFVTEMQAFVNRPASEVRGGSSRIAQTYDVSASTQLLDNPHLSHDVAFTMVTGSGTGEPASRQYSFVSGLSAVQRFSPVFTGNARVGWGESGDQSGSRSEAYNYSAVLAATPLKTLRSSLVYGGQVGESNGQSTSSNAGSLNMTADLYKGISMNVSGGASEAVSNNGQKSKSMMYQTSAGLVPNSRLTVNMNYGSARTASSGGSQPVATTLTTTRWGLDAAYRPFDTLYLTASLSRFSQTNGSPYTLRNYGLNWSPLSDGSLQFSYMYSESLRSDTDSLEKVEGPSLSWRIIPRASLDLTYVTITEDSPTLTQEIRSFSAVYKMTL